MRVGRQSAKCIAIHCVVLPFTHYSPPIMPQEEDEEHPHPIFAAIADGDEDQVLALLYKDPAALKEENADGCLPLYQALLDCETGIALGIMKFVWRHGLQHLVDSQDALEPALGGYSHDHLEVLVALERMCGDTLDVDIGLAAERVSVEALAYLLLGIKNRKNISSLDMFGHTPLSVCIRARDQDCVEHVQMLLAAGADPTLPEGNTSPLRWAKDTGNSDLVKILEQALEGYRTRLLLKARAVTDAAHAASLQQTECNEKKAMEAAPLFLRSRVRRLEPLPLLTMAPEEAKAEAAGVLDKALALPTELFDELWGYFDSNDGSQRNERTWRRIVNTNVAPVVKRVMAMQTEISKDI